LLFANVVGLFRKGQVERWPIWCPNEVSAEDRDEWNAYLVLWTNTAIINSQCSQIKSIMNLNKSR